MRNAECGTRNGDDTKNSAIRVPHSTIVLATFDGDRFLPEQIQSIRNQSFTDWQLLIRDDGSGDNTAKLIEEFAAQDQRITVLRDDLGRLGSSGNFDVLLSEAFTRGAGRIFLADQDDVWKPEKISKELELLGRAEASLGCRTPILVYSDLEVVDSDLELIHESFMVHQGIHHEPHRPLGTLLVQNFVTGCSALLNRALVELVLPIPVSTYHHDWWVALLAASSGNIRYLPESTVLYRQHDRNRVGAKGYFASVNPWHKSWRVRSPEGFQEFSQTLAQARALEQRLRERSEKKCRCSLAFVRRYTKVFDRHMPGILRCGKIHSLGVRRQDWFRQFLLLVRLSLMTKRTLRFLNGWSAGTHESALDAGEPRKLGLRFLHSFRRKV